MRILFLSHYFPPEVNAPASRTYEHCQRWVRDGHEVTVITCAPNCPTGVVFDGYRNAWRSEETIDGIRVIRVWTYVAANKGFAKRIMNFLSYMLTATWAALWCRKADVVVATSPQFFCGWAGVFSKWLLRKPLVLEIRDLWPESILAVGAMKRNFVIRILEWFERQMYGAADRIVTVGEGYRRQLEERNVPSEKIDVIPNGVDLDRVAAQMAAAADDPLERPENRFVCSYIGTVGMAHGLEVVVEAAKTLRSGGRDDVEFWIVGDGAERERLQAEVEQLGLSTVVFHGMVPKEMVPRVIEASDACLVHLRKTDLFTTVMPSKVFEIMAQNVPIVMGVEGEAQRVVLDGKGGVAMEPGDADSLLTAMDEIRRNKASVRRGSDYVAEHYNRERLAERMLAVLHDVAGLPVPRPVEEHVPAAAEKRRAA
ncbi:MAG: glycosyltransferase family 4 protein [Maioricimonas sp. JB049]